MAFADWTFVQTIGTPEASITSTSPLVGSSSLRLSFTVTITNAGQAAYVVDSGVPLGMSKGVIRTLVQQFSTASAIEEYSAGIFFLAEDTDFGSSSSTNAYSVTLDTENQGVRVRYSDIQDGLGGELAVVTGLGFTVGVTRALEVQWNNDQVGIGGVHIVVRVGTMTDFSDLSEVINLVDPVNPTTDGYEGICHFNDFAVFTPPVWYFDSTSIRELI